MKYSDENDMDRSAQAGYEAQMESDAEAQAWRLEETSEPRSFTSTSLAEYRKTSPEPRFYVRTVPGDFDIIDSSKDRDSNRVRIPSHVISLNDAERFIEKLRSGEETPSYYR